MRIALTLIAVVCLAALAGFVAHAAPSDKPLFSLAGSHSAVAERRVELITEPARWEAVWTEHAGGKVYGSGGADMIPRVDFSRCMVLAMFAGSSTNGSGWVVEEVLNRDGHTVIRYNHIRFQTASFDGSDSSVKTTSYGFAVLQRSTLPFILEENTQNLIGGPPIWTERQRLPAIAPLPDARGR